MLRQIKRQHRRVLWPWICLGVFCFLLIFLFGINRWKIEASNPEKGESKVDYQSQWNASDAKAYVTGSLLPFVHIPIPVQVEGNVDTSQPGQYSVRYQASFAWMKLDQTNTITVKDANAPKITLLGGDSITIPLGSEFKDRYSAMDPEDGDLTDQVKVEGSVDTSKEGEYTLHYTVQDKSDNKAEASRKVIVSKAAPASDPLTSATDTPSEGKIIYLTFDDGPGKYTERLLGILAKYNVKATFFTTNQFPEYQDLLTKEAQAGHTVAEHSYSHKYETVYASTEAFWDDFNRMNDIIEQKTGKRTKLFRFPGGSSNAISRKFTPGIMTQLVEEAKQKGYAYSDWNVSSGDGGEVHTPEAVLKNCKDGVSARRVSVILCHDIKEFTVDAMESFIPWALQNGYTFLPMTENSFLAHHGHINN